MDNKEEENLVCKGFRLFYDGDIQNAFMIAKKAIETEIDNPFAWALSGSCKAHLGEIDDAIYECKKALKLRPHSASICMNLGKIYEGVEKWEEAIQQYKQAIQIEPGKTVYRAALGRIFIKKKRFKEAIELFEKCLKEEPDNEAYNHFLGLAYNDIAINDWYEIEENRRICCTEESAIEGLDYLRKAFDLRVEDDELESLIINNLVLAEWAVKKHWTRSILETVKGGFKALIAGVILGMILELIFADNGGNVIGILGVVGVLVVWIVTGFKPGWEINKMVISQLR